MATGSDDINKVRKQLEDLRKSLDDVSKRSIDRIIKSLTDGKASLEEWNLQLQNFHDIADRTSGSLDYVYRSIKDSVNELSKQNTYLNTAKSIGNQISKTAAATLAVRKGETAIDIKSLKAAKERIEIQKRALILSKNNVGNFSKEHKEIQSILNKLDEYEDGLQGVLDTNEKINKQLGAAPLLAGGIDKAFQKLGLPNLGMKDAIDETHKLGQVAARTGDTGFDPMSTLTSKIGSNLRGMVTPANLLQAGIGLLVTALIQGDKATGDLAKSMNMTYSEANRTRAELTDIAAASGDASVHTKNLQETYMAVGKALGTNSMLNEKDLVTMTKLTHQAGMTYDELMQIEKISLINNKSLEQNTSKILGSVAAYNRKNKLALNEKDILKDVNKMSASLKLSLGGSADKMAEAASKAKQFGLNLEQTEKISQNLLNFESSIENELSAELLTGKDLNFERARGLALNGQTADAAAEIAKQVGSSADFTKMNVIQQEAMAKAAGMTRDELAQSLIDREALTKMGVKGAKSAQEAYNELKKQGLSEAEINKRIGDDKLSGMYKQQSIQERFNDSMLKLQEVFVALAEPILAILSPFMDLINIVLPSFSAGLNLILTPIKWIGEAFNSITTMFSSWPNFLMTTGKLLGGIVLTYGLLKAYNLFITTQKMLQGSMDARAAIMGKGRVATAIAEAVANVTGASAKTLGIAGIVAIAAAGLAYNFLSSKATPAGDVSSSAKGKTQISTKEGGLFELSRNDDFAAAPGLLDRLNNPGKDQIGENKKQTQVQERQIQAKQNAQAVITQQTLTPSFVLHSNTYMDGKKVASGVGQNSQELYKASMKDQYKLS